jgi:hypothetical protein
VAAGGEEVLRVAGGIELFEAALSEQEDGGDLWTTDEIGKKHELISPKQDSVSPKVRKGKPRAFGARG